MGRDTTITPSLERNHRHPLVWDNEHDDTFIGMAGTLHDVECAQRHVDRTMVEEWGMQDCRFIVERVEPHPGGTFQGDVIQPFTVARGRYVSTH